MQKQYPDDVVAISLNLDHDDDDMPPDDELQTEVRDKLVELNLAVTNVMSTDSYDEVTSHHDLFSLPAALIYNAEGQLIRKFDGDLNYEKAVFPLVAELLGTTTPDSTTTPENNDTATGEN